MRPLTLLAILIAALTLSGCHPAKETFSCEPQESSQRIDVDQYRTPAKVSPNGDKHC